MQLEANKPSISFVSPVMVITGRGGRDTFWSMAGWPMAVWRWPMAGCSLAFSWSWDGNLNQFWTPGLWSFSKIGKEWTSLQSGILGWKIMSFISTATNQYPPSFTAPYQNVTWLPEKKTAWEKDASSKLPNYPKQHFEACGMMPISHIECKKQCELSNELHPASIQHKQQLLHVNSTYFAKYIHVFLRFCRMCETAIKSSPHCDTRLWYCHLESTNILECNLVTWE